MSELPNNHNTITPAALAQTLEPQPPLWPVTYDHLSTFNSRDDIVPNRLATHMGPLLGFPYPEGPHNNTSWLTDYADLTLTEIRQGFPKRALDSRGEPLRPTDTIVAATLKKYRPSKKDAVALTGINRLFEAQTEAFVDAVGSTAFRELPYEEKIRSWSGLLLGSLWCQPLLFMAGQRASAFQNIYRPHEMHYPDRLVDQPRARCEVQPHGSFVPGKYTPFDFNLVSETFLALGKLLEADMADKLTHRPIALLKGTVSTMITESLPGPKDLVVARGETGRAVLSPTEKLAVARDILADRLRREVLLDQ